MQCLTSRLINIRMLHNSPCRSLVCMVVPYLV